MATVHGVKGLTAERVAAHKLLKASSIVLPGFDGNEFTNNVIANRMHSVVNGTDDNWWKILTILVAMEHVFQTHPHINVTF